jgi:aryl-alcohol dehydrogenase-like predicted oxidoreductase
LCTKFRPEGNDGALRPAELLRATLEQSLRDLQTDYVDVLYLHGVRPDLLDQILDRFYEPLEQARRDGLVRFLGVTETFENDHAHATMQLLMPRKLIDVAMVGYNALSPAPARHVLPLAQETDTGVVIMCAVRGVLLKPERIRAVVAEWKEQSLLAKDAVPDDEPLGWLLGPWADSIPSAAYKFARAHPGVSSVLTGTGRAAHLDENAEAILGTPLPDEVVERLYDVFGPVGRNASF